jgi:hypothetical protein
MLTRLMEVPARTMLGGEDTGEAVDARPDAQRLGRVP